MQSFIFGGEGMPKTPQELARMRAVAEAMAPRRAPQNVGEGLSSIGNALAMRILMSRADKAETAGIDKATSRFNSVADSLLRPSLTESVDAPPADALQSDSTQTTLPPVEGTMQNARSMDRGSVQDYAGMTLKSGIKSAADALGISAEDLATAISYETAGTFDPLKKGPTTKWGQHRGLIQFGEPQAIENGVDWNKPLESQLGPDGAVVKYLRAAGVKPGMPLLDIYSAINAGGVNRYDASDANNGGAWGTVKDKVDYQMDGHRQKALALLADDAPATDAFASQPNLNQVPVVPVPDGFEKPVEVADNSNYFPPRPRKSVARSLARIPQEQMSELYEAASDPFLPPQLQARAKMLLDQLGNEQKALLEQQLREQDPKYQLDLEKGRLEVQDLKNPRIKPADKARLDLDRQKFEADTASDKARLDLDREKLDWEKNKKPETIQKYEYYRKLTEEVGGKALGPLEWEQALRKSSANQTNVDTGTIPAGYRANRDENGRVISIEPIPGSQQAQDAAAAQKKVDLNRTQTALKGDIVSQDIDRALAGLDAEGLPSTGWGSVLSSMPGTNAKALDGLLKTIKANVSFDTLNQMRQASPTGGALGSVTEKELSMLQATLGNLEQSQDDEVLKDNLNRVWNVYQDIVHGPGNGPERRKLSFMEKPAAKKPIIIDGFTIEPIEE